MIINRIVKILEKHTSEHGPENLLQLTAIATKFEERIYYSASSQMEPLRKIFTKMVNMESKPQSSGEVNSIQSNSSCSYQNPPDAGSQSVHSQMHNQVKSLFVPFTNPSQAPQKHLSHTVQIKSAGVQSFGNLVSTVPSVSGLSDNTTSNGVSQSCRVQNVSGIPLNSIGKCLPSNTLLHSQRQMPERQHMQQVVAQQHQQLSQNPHQYIYQQQVQNQMLKCEENIQPSLLHSHIMQQQNLLQPVQLQTSSSLQSNQHNFQQAQPTMQSASLSSLLYSYFSSLQLTPSLLRQYQQSILSSLQEQQLMGKQPEETNTQKNELLGKPNSFTEMQHHEQQKWLQHQQQQQQQQVCQQNEISNFHQQLLGPHQQLLGPQPSVSNMQTNQQSVHVRQAQQTSSMLLSTQGQQPQVPQKQLINQLQSQSPHLQQQLGLEKQQFSLQRDMHQRQKSGVLIQPQNVIEQQKQLLQLKRARPDPSSTMTDSLAQRGQTNIVDEQEELYQKAKVMKELYLPCLVACYKEIIIKIQQQEGSPLHTKLSKQIESFKRYKTRLGRVINLLQSPLGPHYTKGRLIECEKVFRSKEAFLLHHHQQGLQQFQLLGDLLQSQVSQLKHYDNQMNSLMQPRNIQTSVATTQPTASMPSLLTHMGVSSAHPSIMSTPTNMHPALQSNSNMLSNLNLKQQQEQQSMQAHHAQQCLSSQQLIQQQDQQLLKQQHQHFPLLQHNLHQQYKLQQSTESLVHQMPPKVHYMSEMNHMKLKQGMGDMSGPFQNSAFHHQQIKAGGALFSVPSLQLLQTASPQISQHSSSEIDRQSLSTSVSKTGTPLQSLNSPSIAPSPFTPIDSSPLTGNPEKPQTSGVSSFSNAGNIGQNPTPISPPQAHLVICTPGISASPLLAEFTSTDTNQGNASTMMYEKSSAAHRPIERLIKVVQSMSPKALIASVDEMRKLWHQGNAIPLNVLSSDESVNDSFKRVHDLDISELESTATSRIKRCRIEFVLLYDILNKLLPRNAGRYLVVQRRDFHQEKINHALMEEIREINQQLTNTVVDISDEDIKMTAGIGDCVPETIVKCSFSNIPLSSGLKLQDVSAQMLPVLSMWLLVSSNYPNSSPIILDKFPVNLSKEYVDLLVKTRSRYSKGLCCLEEPISLWKMVKNWDVCAHAVLTEYAYQYGGGKFSSSFGGWKNNCSVIGSGASFEGLVAKFFGRGSSTKR